MGQEGPGPALVTGRQLDTGPLGALSLWLSGRWMPCDGMPARSTRRRVYSANSLIAVAKRPRPALELFTAWGSPA
jgi:hypothetical protein